MTKETNKLEKLWLCIAICVILPIIISIIYLYIYAVNVPYFDQWNVDLPLLEKFYGNNLTISDFVGQVAEARPAFPRALILIVALFTKYNVIYEIFASFLVYCVSFVFVFLMHKSDHGLNKVSLIMLAPISWYFFNLLQVKNILAGNVEIAVWGTPAFLAAVYFIDASRALDRRFAISLVAAVVSSFSFVSGLAVWPCCFAQLVFQKSECAAKKIAIWVFIGLITGALYLYDYQSYHNARSWNFLDHPFLDAQFFLSSVGSNIFRFVDASAIFGIILIIFAGYSIMKSIDLDSKSILNKNQKWITIILFGILVSLQITVGRSGNPNWAAMPPRYLLLTHLSVVGLYGSFLNILFAPGNDVLKSLRAKAIEVADLNLSSWKTHFRYVLFCIFLIILIMSSIGMSIQGYENGRVFHDERSLGAYYLKTYEFQPDKNFELLFPSKNFFYYAYNSWKIPFLKKYNLTIFSENDVNINELPELSGKTLYNIDAINNYNSDMQENISFAVGIDEISIAGWAVDASNNKNAKAVFITIDDRINIPVMYGLERADVSDRYKNIAYRNSGFRASFASRILKGGPHSLSIKIVSSDGRGYYEAKTNSSLYLGR